MVDYQRTFLQEYRAHERIISRQNIKELKISALRHLPSVKDKFVEELKASDETFQRFSSKKSRLDRLRTLRDEKSFKKLPFERKNNSPSCLPLPLVPPLVPKANIVKVPSFPIIKAKKLVIRTASLVKNGSDSKSKNPSPGISRGIQQEINQTKTIKSKDHTENGYELNDISGVGLSIGAPNFPIDISCIHPVSELSFAPDDFSFTVPESIQKLPYRPSFVPEIGWDAIPNLSRVSTPMAFKIQKEAVTSVRNKTNSKLTKPLSNVINKIPGVVNQVPKKSPVLSETRILPKGKTTFQFSATTKNSSGRYSLAVKPQNQRRSPLQNGLENNKSTNNLKVSNKENACVSAKVSPVNSLDKKAALKVSNPTDGSFRTTYSSRASLLPSSHKNSGVNRLSMAIKDFNRLQCNNNSLKQSSQQQQKRINAKMSIKDVKLTNTSSGDSKKLQQKKLSSSVEIQNSCTKISLKPSASLANMEGTDTKGSEMSFKDVKLTNTSSGDSRKLQQKKLSSSVEIQNSCTKISLKPSESLENMESSDANESKLESLKSHVNKSVSEPVKNQNDSSVSAVPINKNFMDNTVGTHESIENGNESKKTEESSCSINGNETSDLNISLMRKNIDNLIEQKDPDQITVRKTIMQKDVYRNSFSLMSTCFIDDEILDDSISAEIAALDLSSSMNMAGDTPLRKTKIFSLANSPFGKPLKNSLKFLNEVRSPWRSAITLESIKNNSGLLADKALVSTNNDDGSIFKKEMVCDASDTDDSSSCGRNNNYHEGKTPLKSQDILCSSQQEFVGKNSQAAVSEKGSPTVEKGSLEMSFLGTPFKPSGINNVPIRGDLITFSPIISRVM